MSERLRASFQARAEAKDAAKEAEAKAEAQLAALRERAKAAEAEVGGAKCHNNLPSRPYRPYRPYIYEHNWNELYSELDSWNSRIKLYVHGEQC